MTVYKPGAFPVEGVPLFIPGAGVDTYTGELLGRSIARVDVALAAVADGITPAIIFSGGKAQGAASSEATAMDEYLVAHADSVAALPPRFLDNNAVRTIQNFAFSMPLFLEAGVLTGEQALNIVTDPAHMPRLLYVARKVLPESVRIFPIYSDYAAQPYEQNRERLALPVTMATLVGMRDGAGADAALAREQHYAQIKDSVKAAEHQVARVANVDTARAIGRHARTAAQKVLTHLK